MGGVAYLLGKSNSKTISQLVEFVRDRDDREEARMFRAIDQLNKPRYFGTEVKSDDPLPSAAAELELGRKYSDVSNKYNEILELVTASHQGIGQLMAEFSEFKSTTASRLQLLEEWKTESIKKDL